MSLQDKLERVLREIHIVFADSRQYMDDEDLIIVEKHKIFQLLNQLNVYVYEMMDEHEITEAGKDRFRREVKRSAEKLVAEAQKQAEDVYAASVMYAEEALDHVQSAIEQANTEVENLLQRTKYALSEQKETIQMNQLELTEQLQDMADAKVYFRMIEDRKRQIERKKAESGKERKQIEEWSWKGTKEKRDRIKPEIKINTAYFEKTGMSLNEVDGNDTFDEPVKEAPQVTVNLDAEYFKWKKEQESGQTAQTKAEQTEAEPAEAEKTEAEQAETTEVKQAEQAETTRVKQAELAEPLLEEINIDDIHIEEINIEDLELEDLNMEGPETEKSAGGIAT